MKKFLRIFILLAVLAAVIVPAIPFATVYADDPPTLITYDSSTYDGFTRGFGDTYATEWAKTTSAGSISWAGIGIGQMLAGGNYYIERGFVYFNTSTLPDDAIVISGKLGICLYHGSPPAKNFSVVIQTGMPARPELTITNDDYDKSFYSGDGGSANTTSVSADWLNISLSTSGKSWINVSGWTKFCLRSNYDISGIAPLVSAGDHIDVYASESGSTVPFLQIEYVTPTYLTTSSGSGGNVSTPGEGTYAYNKSEVVNISATADACYHFVNWTGNTTDIGNVNAASTNISMGTTNKTATANFAINTSIITYVNGSNGGITGTLSQTINCGSSTTNVTAVPNACYRFVNWNDSSTMNPRNDVGTSTNQSFTANFAINTSVITYSAGAGGTISGTASQTLNCGTNSTTVTAVPNSCFVFVNWSDGRATAARNDTATSTNQGFTANFNSLATDTFFPPTSITYSADSNSVILAWVKGANTSQTYIRWKIGSYPTSIVDGNIIGNVSGYGYIHTGLSSGYSYYYKMWGMNGSCYSATNSTVLCTTTAGYTGATTNPIPTTDTSGWTTSPNGSVLENNPLYETLNLEADEIGIPHSTWWFLLGMGFLVVAGLFVYTRTNNILLAISVVIVFGGILASALAIIPIWCIVVFGLYALFISWKELR